LLIQFKELYLQNEPKRSPNKWSILWVRLDANANYVKVRPKPRIELLDTTKKACTALFLALLWEDVELSETIQKVICRSVLIYIQYQYKGVLILILNWQLILKEYWILNIKYSIESLGMVFLLKVSLAEL